MPDNRPRQKSGLPAPEARASDRAPKKPAQEEAKGVLARLVREPREIVWLVRAGRLQEAARRCLVASAVLLGFAIMWFTVVPGAGLLEMVLLVPPSANPDPARGNWLLDAIMFIGLIPSLSAYLIVPFLSVPGIVVGYLSLVRAEGNVLRGIGSIVGNVLVTGVWVFAGMALIAMFVE